MTAQVIISRDDMEEIEQFRVGGPLRVRHVESLGYTQYIVAGFPVEPDTIRRADVFS